MTSVRFLGLCGLIASVLTSIAGFLKSPVLLGIAGVVMIVGNIYAMWKG